ncbi:hypothetical protein O9G_005555 [Rozella allomycis CSF55]|uniref:Uncharacterized protein n=2 Tax=Rozella allomycis (strain CSF55) TaxID=988480 RepID=A0A075B421_ROZAC|nr:hypothetical protein O9G_005555 [Rozella allomycis CSF55]|eukprot:EPZ35954.1 hypothetical protein O9G_005555 [Rozella allomycis CSF55]
MQPDMANLRFFPALGLNFLPKSSASISMSGYLTTAIAPVGIEVNSPSWNCTNFCYGLYFNGLLYQDPRMDTKSWSRFSLYMFDMQNDWMNANYEMRRLTNNTSMILYRRHANAMFWPINQYPTGIVDFNVLEKSSLRSPDGSLRILYGFNRYNFNLPTMLNAPVMQNATAIQLADNRTIVVVNFDTEYQLMLSVAQDKFPYHPDVFQRYMTSVPFWNTPKSTYLSSGKIIITLFPSYSLDGVSSINFGLNVPLMYFERFGAVHNSLLQITNFTTLTSFPYNASTIFAFNCSSTNSSLLFAEGNYTKAQLERSYVFTEMIGVDFSVVVSNIDSQSQQFVIYLTMPSMFAPNVTNLSVVHLSTGSTAYFQGQINPPIAVVNAEYNSKLFPRPNGQPTLLIEFDKAIIRDDQGGPPTDKLQVMASNIQYGYLIPDAVNRTRILYIFFTNDQYFQSVSTTIMLKGLTDSFGTTLPAFYNVTNIKGSKYVVMSMRLTISGDKTRAIVRIGFDQPSLQQNYMTVYNTRGQLQDLLPFLPAFFGGNVTAKWTTSSSYGTNLLTIQTDSLNLTLYNPMDLMQMINSSRILKYDGTPGYQPIISAVAYNGLDDYSVDNNDYLLITLHPIAKLAFMRMGFSQGPYPDYAVKQIFDIPMEWSTFNSDYISTNVFKINMNFCNLLPYSFKNVRLNVKAWGVWNIANDIVGPYITGSFTKITLSFNVTYPMIITVDFTDSLIPEFWGSPITNVQFKGFVDNLFTFNQPLSLNYNGVFTNNFTSFQIFSTDLNGTIIPDPTNFRLFAKVGFYNPWSVGNTRFLRGEFSPRATGDVQRVFSPFVSVKLLQSFQNQTQARGIVVEYRNMQDMPFFGNLTKLPEALFKTFVNISLNLSNFEVWKSSSRSVILLPTDEFNIPLFGLQNLTFSLGDRYPSPMPQVIARQMNTTVVLNDPRRDNQIDNNDFISINFP